jgi:hypothetical protein
MANVSLALEALGIAGRWSLVAGQEDAAPACPDALEPLAVLSLNH